MGRAITDKHVNMIFRYLTGYDLKLVFHGNLAQNVPGSYSYLARQYCLPVFRNPDNMDLQICLGVSTDSITSHSDSI